MSTIDQISAFLFRNESRPWRAFFLSWVVLNLLQGFFTPIVEDEAYYWMYSNYLDWGYFDHPPMIALFIRAGSWIGGEGGVRLVTVLAQGGSLYLIWKIIQRHWPGSHSPILFFAIAFSVFLFQVFGFIATPDSPLLFFASAFFFLYGRFLEKERWGYSLLLGVVCAALLYSKYHGILLIGFTVLSNPVLFRKKQFYLAALTGFVLFLPHLYWQYVHDFPSFRYHLVERASSFRPWYVVEFFMNMVIVYNPFLWPFIIRTVKKADWKPVFQRALYFNFFGFLLFFFLSSLRGHVQPQWTVIATLPLIIFMYAGNFEVDRYRRQLVRVGVICLPLVLIARIIIAVDYFSIPFHLNHPEAYARTVHEFAGDRKVVFNNSYQKASVYAFYDEKPESFSASTLTSRRSQFDIWKLEVAYHNKPVIWIGGQINSRERLFPVGQDSLSYSLFDPFLAFHKVRPLAMDLPPQLKAGQKYTVSLKIKNVYPYDLDFNNASKVRVEVFWKKEGAISANAFTEGTLPVLPQGTERDFEVAFGVPPSLAPGFYQMGFAFQYGDLNPFPAGNWTQVVIHQ